MRLFHREAHTCKISPRDDASIEISCRADAPLCVAPASTSHSGLSHPGYRPMPKNATIHASLGLMGESRCSSTAGQREAIMRERFSGSMITVAIAAAAVSAVISVSIDRTSAQAPAGAATAPAPAPALKTPWGEPDLQGIWTDETDTPLQRPAKYAGQEFFTTAQRIELDEARTAVLAKADAGSRAEHGAARDVAGAYHAQFVSFKRTGARTSLIVDPPNWRMPPLTPQAQKIAAAEREFRHALLLATDTCK